MLTRVRTEFLAFSPPSLGEEEIAEVVDALRSDWITTGPKVKRFESDFAERVEAPAAVAVSSCTDALQVALASMGVGYGDAVITTTMTFVATAHVIDHLGAQPILVDIDPRTLNIDPVAAARGVEKARADGFRPKAIIPVHHSGQPCEMGQIADLCRSYRLGLVEDAAHALPAAYRGRPIGSILPDLPHAVAFSFYATKNMTTGEGGMLTGSPELIEEARLWTLHGMSRDAWNRYGAKGSWHYDVVRPGFKCNMTDMQAALGIHQLRKLDGFQKRRHEIVDRYREGLGDVEELELPIELDHVEHAWHLFVVRLHLDRLAIDRARFIDELKARNIGASVHFIPVHLHPYYRDTYGYRPGDLPVAEGEYERIVSLPLNARMTVDDADDVIAAVRDIVDEHRR